MTSPDEHAKQRDEIHRLRGAFLDALVGLESLLETAISLYFGVQKEKKHRFALAVLGKLTAWEKIEAFSKIIRAKESPQLKGYVSRLRELHTYRNQLAHSGIGADWDHGDMERTFRWTTTKWTEDGPVVKPIDLGEMNDKLLMARQLAVLVFIVVDEIAVAPNHEINPAIDWWTRYESSLSEDGIPIISKELHQYFDVRGPVPEDLDELEESS